MFGKQPVTVLPSLAPRILKPGVTIAKGLSQLRLQRKLGA